MKRAIFLASGNIGGTPVEAYYAPTPDTHAWPYYAFPLNHAGVWIGRHERHKLVESPSEFYEWVCLGEADCSRMADIAIKENWPAEEAHPKEKPLQHGEIGLCVDGLQTFIRVGVRATGDCPATNRRPNFLTDPM